MLSILLYRMCKRCKGRKNYVYLEDEIENFIEDEIENFNDSNSNSSIDSDTSSLSATMRGRKDIFAPAGKIGLSIGTSKYGPIIDSINDESPLKGSVFPGDYVLAVDDVDTSDWLAQNVAQLVAEKTDTVKKLTLLSTHWDGLEAV